MPLVLAFLFGACATESTPETPPERPAVSAPMTFEDSADALQADMDSLRRTPGQTRDVVDAEFHENDSMPQVRDLLGIDMEATRQRAEVSDAETEALLGQSTVRTGDGTGALRQASVNGHP